MSELTLIATATFGLEAVVSRELKALGYHDQKTQDGRVHFQADEQAIARCNLWLRSSDRVLLRIGQFEARDFGELFDQTNALPWERWLGADAEFPVRGKSVRSQLHHVPTCQKMVKKAIVERLRTAHNTETLPETGPQYTIEVAIVKDLVTLTIDTSGEGLHKRGYRSLQGQAPLKETLAAGLIQLSFWNRERVLHDAFCGTGTIPIEAAMIARNLAPGRLRSFTAEHWPNLPNTVWKTAREEAADLAMEPEADSLPIIGTDHDAQVLKQARYHAQQAGVGSDIHWQQQTFADLTSSRHYGCLISNPPYGERLGEKEDAEALYRSMLPVLSQLDDWSFYLITSHPQFEELLGRKSDRRRKLYNGRIECTYHQFHGPRPPRREKSAEKSES